MQLPTVSSETLAFDHPLFKIVRLTRHLDGQPLPDYYRMELPPAVMILAWSSEGKLLVCREWRQPIGDWVLGLPGGRVDEHKGEKHQQAAKRELLEETGAQSDSWSYIGSYHPFTGWTNQEVHLWSAKSAQISSPPEPEISEFIQQLWLYPHEIAAKVKAGHRLDGILASSLWLNENSGS